MVEGRGCYEVMVIVIPGRNEIYTVSEVVLAELPYIQVNFVTS